MSKISASKFYSKMAAIKSLGDLSTFTKVKNFNLQTNLDINQELFYKDL